MGSQAPKINRELCNKSLSVIKWKWYYLTGKESILKLYDRSSRSGERRNYFKDRWQTTSQPSKDKQPSSRLMLLVGGSEGVTSLKLWLYLTVKVAIILCFFYCHYLSHTELKYKTRKTCNSITILGNKNPSNLHTPTPPRTVVFLTHMEILSAFELRIISIYFHIPQSTRHVSGLQPPSKVLLMGPIHLASIHLRPQTDVYVMFFTSHIHEETQIATLPRLEIYVLLFNLISQ